MGCAASSESLFYWLEVNGFIDAVLCKVRGSAVL